MAKKTLNPDWEALMQDPRLTELCELQRVGDEALDIISLQETQHSNILAWLFNSREGHGQGDEILRDLLMSASIAANEDRCVLDKSGKTAQFFKRWPPSRIRTSSFGSAFCVLELVLKESDRADLFVVDPHNRFVLLLENKKRDKGLSMVQLNRYRSSYEEVVRLNQRLDKYDVAYLTLSRIVDDAKVEALPCRDTWLHLGYDWLKLSAQRAMMHVSRGNAAAQLVLSYCNRQTDWENPDDEASLQLAARLHAAHPAVLKSLVDRHKANVIKRWLTDLDDPGTMALFALQNAGAFELLRKTRGMASLRAALLEEFPELKGNITHTGKRLRLCPPGCEMFTNDNGWQVYLSIVYTDGDAPPYNLRLNWAGTPEEATVEEKTLFQKLVEFNNRFAKWEGAAVRVVPLATVLTQQALFRKLKGVLRDLKTAIAPSSSSSHHSPRMHLDVAQGKMAS